ncbi:hypothetical protein J2128_001676 [Methanomicrobium sp. W14]|nr:hypothetical protein [Methanomicrobium sp. W14]
MVSVILLINAGTCLFGTRDIKKDTNKDIINRRFYLLLHN